MTTNRLSIRAILIALALTVTNRSDAQIVRPDSIACAKASDSLRVGRIGDASQFWSLPIASACGDTSAVAAALDRRRGLPYSTDLHTFFNSVSIDAGIHHWLLAAATNAATSEPVRVLSLLTLMRSPYAGADADYDSVIAAPLGRICPFSPTGQYDSTSAVAFASLASQARNAADGLVNDDNTSPPVRNAANCLGNAIRLRAGWALRAIGPLNTQAITLTYLCGNVFRVRNTNEQPVTVRYELVGTSDSASLEALAARPPIGYWEGEFETTSPGTVRLYLEDQLIATVPNGNTRCTH